MESGCDVYDNLPKFDTYEEIEKLRIENDQLKDLIQSLESDIEKLCSKITEMKNSQDVLSRNISELYKTAKREIDRKDRIIADLRAQVEKFTSHNQMRNNYTIKRDRSPNMNADSICKRFKREHDDKRGYSRSRSTSRDRYRTNKDRDRKNDDEKIDRDKKSSREDVTIKKDNEVSKREVKDKEKETRRTEEHESKRYKFIEVDNKIKKGEVVECGRKTSEKLQNEKMEKTENKKLEEIKYCGNTQKQKMDKKPSDIKKTETNEILLKQQKILEFGATEIKEKEKKDLEMEHLKGEEILEPVKTNEFGKTIENESEKLKTKKTSHIAKKEEMPQFSRKEKQETLQKPECKKAEKSDKLKKEGVSEKQEIEENKNDTKKEEILKSETTKNESKKEGDDKKNKTVKAETTINNRDKRSDNKKVNFEKQENMKKIGTTKSDVEDKLIKKDALKSEKTEKQKKESHKRTGTKNTEGNGDKKRKEKKLDSGKTSRSEKQENNKTEESRTVNNLERPETKNIPHKVEKDEIQKSSKTEQQENVKKLESKKTDVKKESPNSGKTEEENKERTRDEFQKQEKNRQKKTDDVVDETKKGEVNESARVLRSSTRKNSHREITPILLDSDTNKVTLTDDGEIPVLHIPDDASSKANNESMFDLKLCASTPIRTDDMELLKQDLHLSFEQSSTENAILNSASINNTGVTPRKGRKRYLVQLID